MVDRNCSLIRVFRVHFHVNMKDQDQNESAAKSFYIDLKGPFGAFVSELHLTIPFS